MIQMKVTDPNSAKIRPIKFLLGQTMWCVRTNIEQDRGGLSLQPKARRPAMRMWNGSAGAQYDQFHMRLSFKGSPCFQVSVIIQRLPITDPPAVQCETESMGRFGKTESLG